MAKRVRLRRGLSQQEYALQATVHAYNQISLSWNAISGADWYDVEIRDGGGRWNHLRSVYATSVDMAGFDAATQYSIRVRAVGSNWPDWSYGNYSNTVTPTTSAYQASPDYTVTDDSSWTTAYNNAVCGDVIEITAGTVLTEKTCPPYRAGTAKFLTIRSSGMASLPTFDQRVDSGDLSNMPTFRVTTSDTGAINVPSGIHHITFEGIALRSVYVSQTRHNFIVVFNRSFLGGYANDPYNIEFHRCYFDSPDPTGGFAQCDSGLFSYGSARVVVKDCYLKEITGNISDTQAIGILRGHEWAVNNCHLQGGAENVIFGGSYHGDTGYVPHLFIFRRNHFYKPLNWKFDDPSYDGYTRVIKNLFELKYGVRVLLEDNRFEHSWVGAQNYTVVFTPRDESGTMPWAKDEELQVRYNHLLNITGGFQLLASDSTAMTTGQNRVTIQHNLIENIGWGSTDARMVELNNVTYASGKQRFENIAVRRNTMVADDYIPQYLILTPSGSVGDGWPDGQGVGGLMDFSDNIVDFADGNPPGVFQDGSSHGVVAMDAFFGAGKYTWEDNVQYGNQGGWNNATRYPGQFRETGGIGDVGFVDHANDNFRLDVTSDYYQTQGADNSVYDRTAYCVSGDWTA